MNSFQKRVALVVGVLLNIAVMTGVLGYSYVRYDEGYKAGYEVGGVTAVDQFFRYCHDHGGILSHPDTKERIGCMAVVSKQQEQEQNFLTDI